jgi:hypothetical protein
MNLTRVYCCEQVVDMVLEVEQIDKGVVVECKRFDDIVFPVLQTIVLSLRVKEKSINVD